MNIRRSLSAGTLSSTVVLAGLVLASVPSAWAWEYKLDEESRHFTAAWCGKYIRNLNSFKAPPHMTCTRKISPKFPEFSEPKWETLDPMAHLDVVEGILRQYLEQPARNRWTRANGYQAKIRELYPKTPTVAEMKAAGLTPPDVEKIWLQSRKAAVDAEWAIVGKVQLDGMLKLFRERKRWLGRARFDIDNDGNPDIVYRIGSRGCYRRTFSHGEEKAAPPYDPKLERDKFGWQYWVLERDNDKVAYRRSLHWPQAAHAFFYRGRTYIDGWNRIGEGPPETRMKLTVYEPSYTVSRFVMGQACPIIYCPKQSNPHFEPCYEKYVE